MRIEKICPVTLIYGRIAEIPVSYRKSRSRNMVTAMAEIPHSTERISNFWAALCYRTIVLSVLCCL